MASEEEVNIVIRTVGDTTGAQQVTNALRQTQAAADQNQQQLSARGEAANATLRSLMENRQKTLEAFRAATSMAERFAGAAPTLGPESFGIRGGAATAAAAAQPAATSLAFETLARARQPILAARAGAALAEDDPAAQARLFAARAQQQRQFDALIAERARALRGVGTAIPGAETVPPAALEALNRARAGIKEVGQSATTTALEMARFSGAAIGVGFGLSVFTAAGTVVNRAMESIIGGSLEYQRVATQNTIVLGQQAAGFRELARTISEQAGVSEQSLLEAGTAAAQFSRQVGLGPEQIENLTALSVLLARIQGTNPATTMTQLTAALAGNGQAAAALGIQLDAAYVSFTQLGGASSEVFNQLDASTQAALRYQSALEQIARQSGTALTPQQELASSTSALGTTWETFVTSVGPGVVKGMASIVEAINGAIGAYQRLNDITLERNKQAGGGDEGFKNERSALSALGQPVRDLADRLTRDTERLRAALGQDFEAIGTAAAEANAALRDATGFDAQATAANAAAEATQRATEALNAAGDAAAAAGQAAAGSWTDAAAALDRAQQTAAETAQAQRENQIAALATAVAGPGGQLEAARRNEIAAAEALTELRRESVELGAREASIRLQMLPTQQRMAELQNEANRAQLEATQRALPAQRQLQDLQNAIEEQRLIAISGSRSIEERTAAQRQGALLLRQTPEAELAARRAEVAGLPAQRGAQDVQLEAQLVALQQAATLIGPEFQRQQLSLLAQIAEGAKSAAQRTIEFSVQAINIALNPVGPITEEEEKRIAALAGDQVAAIIHQGVLAVNARNAAPQLVGAT